MNLGDPELELIDPTPNIHSLFIQFDKQFFWAKLASRAIVKWSKRMYSCAGVCSYEGRGGLCNISLSEPLLKLRPRKNLVETLLHEMIHAYLFITSRDNDRDGHGPNFQAHMHRINNSAGIKITIYHDFHDEVKLYQNHVWRCNGPCQNIRPHFGLVRRSSNRAPGQYDYWWESHRRNCGGTFIKIKEPDKPIKKNTKKVTPKQNGDITKYITTEKTVNNIPKTIPTKPVLKDSNILPIKTKVNGGNTLIITKKGPVFNPQVIDNISSGGRPRSNSLGVVETVRSVWASKQLPSNPTAIINNKQVTKPNGFLNNTIMTPNKATKHKIETNNNNPPAKMQKIDDYFKTTASSVLKDIYGKDFQITQTDVNKKAIAISNPSAKINNNPVASKVPASEKQTMPNKSSTKTEPKPLNNITIASTENLVDCPVCKAKVKNLDINQHLDECLNKEVIDTICKENPAAIIPTIPPMSVQKNTKKELKDIVGVIPPIPPYFSVEISDNIANEMLGSNSDSIICPPINGSDYIAKVQEKLNTAVMIIEDDNIRNERKETKESLDPNDVEKMQAIVNKINFEKEFEKFKHKKLESGKISKNLSTEQEKTIDFGNSPSFLNEDICEISTPTIKIEPGTSKDFVPPIKKVCACCGKKIDKPIEEHLDECLAFFENDNTVRNEKASTSFANETIVIDDDDDDDDILDETQTFNATGTKLPCPCCLTMIEETEMNSHLDSCLS